jgi:hypothetical protein
VKRQDDITRRRRLNEGRCPTHGTALVQLGVWCDDGTNIEPNTGPIVGCPRKDCKFKLKVRAGTKLYKALCGD